MAEKNQKPSKPTDGATKRDQRKPAGAAPTPKPGITVVGIGASAGGLQVLQSFFESLPGDTGMAFVVVVHLHPEHESQMAELLQHHTQMKVEQVTERISIEANHVYVIPPNRSILVSDAHLETTEFTEPHGHRMPIDSFFRSLAGAHHDAVAVILSGGGTDGSVGIKDIKEEGGLLMVQDPDEAEYDSMPRAAIGTGLADMILPVRELAHKLLDYSTHVSRVPQNEAELSEQDLLSIQRILSQVHARTGNDFSQYKRSTVLRRIQRRMQINGVNTLEAYLAFLRGNAAEATAMFNDILIGVTNFFRDKPSWDALAEKVIPALFANKEAGASIRVWSIGCATGEEAYSLGMLLMEQAAKLDAHYELQIFASDLDENALGHARAGLYPSAIEADVSPERLERFFTRHGNHYQIQREVRDLVLFTNHSILRDPPFSRIDLIICRNVLIYLQRAVQDNIFDIFHYALVLGGYLFLGSSESAESADELFQVVDKNHRIYQAKPWRGEQLHIPSLPLTVRHTSRPEQATPQHAIYHRKIADELPAPEERHRQGLETYGPPSILVDEDYTIVHISESAGRYLLPPKGPLSADLLKLVRPELQTEVRSALFQAFEKDKAIVSQPVPVQFNGHPHLVVISVRPYRRAPGEHVHLPNRQALVVFLEDESEGEATNKRTQAQVEQRDNAHTNAQVVQLETEVRRLREQLQGTIEEYESSNEEMKAANEELQSINEEYRSATEELETSKEELQSVNEELQTVNSEMKNKLEEISRAHSDLENLMSATEIATLFLDRELRIQRFTPDMQGLFNIMTTDIGRPIMHLTHKLTYPQLVEDAQNVLRSLMPIEREVKGQNDDYYLIRQRPYRTSDDRIDGVVISFIDISELKHAQHALSDLNNTLETRVAERTAELGKSNQKLTQANDLFSALFHANPVPTALIDVEQNLLNDVNLAFLKYFSLERKDVIDKPAEDFGLGLEPGSRSHLQLMAALPKEGNALTNEVQIRLPSGETRTILKSTQYIDLDNIRTLITTFVDITDRKLAEEYLRSMLNAAPDPTIVVDKDGNIVFANEQVENSFGYSGKELISKVVEKLIPERFHVVHPLHRVDFFGDPRVRPMGVGMKLFALRSDGSEFPVEISLSPLEFESGTLVIASIRDITERAQAEGKIRALASSLMFAEQEERQRIAKILHDDLQQRLFAVKMQMPFLKDAYEKQDEQAFHDNLEQLKSWLADAIGTTRTLSRDISPLILQKEGFVDALKWLATQMKELHNLEVILDVNGIQPAFDPNLRTELFEAVRELLFNVVKHTDTRKATVSLEHLDGFVRIIVADEGKGFDAEKLMTNWRDAHGLLNIRQRLNLLGCHLEILSTQKDGTRIVIDVPA